MYEQADLLELLEQALVVKGAMFIFVILPNTFPLSYINMFSEHLLCAGYVVCAMHPVGRSEKNKQGKNRFLSPRSSGEWEI